MKGKPSTNLEGRQWVHTLACWATALSLVLSLTTCQYFDPYLAAGKGELWLLWSNNNAQVWKVGLEGAPPPEAVIDDNFLSAYEDLVIDEGAYKVYWSEGSAGRIWVADLDGQNREEFFFDAALAEIPSLALDPRGRYLYWCTGADWKIQRKPLDGGTVQTVHAGAADINAIALDSVNDLIYFAEGTSILRSTPGPTLSAELFFFGTEPSSGITGIAVDDIGWNVYWADRGLLEIHVQQGDGDGHDVLVTGTDVHDLAVDNYGGRLYWTERTAYAIMSSYLDGNGAAPLVPALPNAPLGVFLDLWP